MKLFRCFLCLLFLQLSIASNNILLPLVINTWPFTNATDAAWDSITVQGQSALDAVEAGCSRCEVERCDGTVGWGGSPDENGETTLDALIIDGPTHNMGAVGALRRIRSAISVARKVLENTNHTLLVGDQATEFAITMGFKESNLTSKESAKIYNDWMANRCQPNFWQRVKPDPRTSCGPYAPLAGSKSSDTQFKGHDTIGMLVIDRKGRIAAGTTTNGLNHKVPGRVGDSPIPGSGAYVNQMAGAASAATGNGDIMMRFLPTYRAVNNFRRGMSPSEAVKDALLDIATHSPGAEAAIILATRDGRYAAACSGIPVFHFSIRSPSEPVTIVKSVKCL